MPDASKWINASGDEPVTQVAVQSLRSRLEPIKRLLPLAAMNYKEDDEYIHSLRVCTRRADAAIEMYSELLPAWRAAWVSKQLRRIRKATNDARDDDVFAGRLADDNSAAAKGLLKRVRKHRAESQRAVLAVYEQAIRNKGRFDRRLEKLLRRVRLRGKRQNSKEPTYRAWAEDQLGPILNEFFELAESDLADTDSLHRFRIMGKKVRYALELLSSAFESDPRKRAYPLLEKLQDQLGSVNDHVSALDRIAHWIDENKDSERRQYLSEMQTIERGRLKESRGDFSAWWNGKHRKQLREAFAKALK